MYIYIYIYIYNVNNSNDKWTKAGELRRGETTALECQLSEETTRGATRNAGECSQSTRQKKVRHHSSALNISGRSKPAQLSLLTLSHQLSCHRIPQTLMMSSQPA